MHYECEAMIHSQAEVRNVLERVMEGSISDESLLIAHINALPPIAPGSVEDKALHAAMHYLTDRDICINDSDYAARQKRALQRYIQDLSCEERSTVSDPEIGGV